MAKQTQQDLLNRIDELEEENQELAEENENMQDTLDSIADLVQEEEPESEDGE